MNANRIEQLQAAAKMIEADGTDAIKSATALVGEDVATALLISHLRRAYGSMDSFPANPNIDRRVNDVLESEYLLH